MMISQNSNTALDIPTLPCNLEAEKMVLGSLFIEPEAILKVAELKPADFFRERNRWVYEAMLALTERREPLDFTLVATELEKKERLAGVGGPSFLTNLLDNTPTAMYIEHYAKLVTDAAAARGLIAAAGKLAELAYDQSLSVEDMRAKANKLMLDATSGNERGGLKGIGTFLPDIIDDISYQSENKDAPMGVPTGFAMLDNILGGLQKSDLIILAARPGMGKSSLALSVAMSAANRHGARVAFFSLEMSSEQIVRRALSIETAIDSHRLRMGEIHDASEWDVLLAAANTLSTTSLYIDDTPGASVADLRAKAYRLHAEHGLDLIIVDYLQLMAGGGGKKGENREQEIAYISRSLKALAKELNVPVLALAQLSRSVEQRADKRPTLSDLRESGSIENDADVVLFIYRDDYYNEHSDKMNIADIIIAKHRHGSTGTVSLYFRKELTQFRDIEITRTEFN